MTLRIARSLFESLGGCVVVVCGQEEMVAGILPSQGMETNLAFGQIDIGADYAVRPDLVDVEGVFQHDSRPFDVGFSDEDHGPFQRLLRVQSPALGECSARGSIFDAYHVASAMCGHKAVRLSPHLVSIAEREAQPDRLLPATVEGFDVGLKIPGTAAAGAARPPE